VAIRDSWLDVLGTGIDAWALAAAPNGRALEEPPTEAPPSRAAWWNRSLRIGRQKQLITVSNAAEGPEAEQTSATAWFATLPTLAGRRSEDLLRQTGRTQPVPRASRSIDLREQLKISTLPMPLLTLSPQSGPRQAPRASTYAPPFPAGTCLALRLCPWQATGSPLAVPRRVHSSASVAQPRRVPCLPLRRPETTSLGSGRCALAIRASKGRGARQLRARSACLTADRGVRRYCRETYVVRRRRSETCAVRRPRRPGLLKQHLLQRHCSALRPSRRSCKQPHRPPRVCALSHRSTRTRPCSFLIRCLFLLVRGVVAQARSARAIAKS
jgi:hypothetical protein